MKNKYFVFMPVIYKSQTNHFVLHTLLARAHILVTCLVAFATTVAFFLYTFASNDLILQVSTQLAWHSAPPFTST